MIPLAIDLWEALDSLSSNVGIDFLDNEIDEVIIQTNSFLTDETFLGANGPFWWVLQMCMALGAMFSLILAANMTYKMMAKNEPLDVLKILRVLGIAIIMCWWYPPSITGIGTAVDWSILEGLAYIPNAVGSFTNDLYEAEAAQVNDKYNELVPLLCKRDTMMLKQQGASSAANANLNNPVNQDASAEGIGSEATVQSSTDSSTLDKRDTYVGWMIFIDKVVTWLAMVLFRVGWWGTMFCQQLLLGMLTIFGPIQWAFSILPKWEGAWAKWITRYLTVHFYGAMLYFVGYFYNLTRSISDRLYLYISHVQQTCTKITIKKSNEGGARAYWQVRIEKMNVFLFRLSSHLSLFWSYFLSNFCLRISLCFGLIIWHEAAMFDIFSNRR